MNCPKCSVPVEEGQITCHVCGEQIAVGIQEKKVRSAYDTTKAIVKDRVHAPVFLATTIFLTFMLVMQIASMVSTLVGIIVGSVAVVFMAISMVAGYRLHSNNPEVNVAKSLKNFSRYEAYYLTTIPVIYSTQFFEQRAAWMEGREAFLTEYFSNPAVREALIRLTDSSVSYNVVDRLQEITCPTLIISSSEDVLVPPTEQQLLHEKIKGSMYVTINGSGHASMYEAPESFAALTLGFANIAGSISV